MADIVDPYGLFGLNENHASLSDARKAYYELALATHPDKMAGDASQFKIVHAAWKWIENQLTGVPDPEEVVARFESAKDEWEEFSKTQDADFPALRDIIGDVAVEFVPRSSGQTEFSKRFNAAWEAREDDGGWKPFPRGGYGDFVTRSEKDEIRSFPSRDIVVYEQPGFVDPNCRHPSPLGVPDELEDYGVPEASPLGCDYSIGLSEPQQILTDARIGRTLEDYERENDGLVRSHEEHPCEIQLRYDEMRKNKLAAKKKRDKVHGEDST